LSIIITMLRFLPVFLLGIFLAVGGPAILQQSLPRLAFQFPFLIRDRDWRVYCYGSITTLNDKGQVFAPGCLSVDKHGNFGEVFSAEGWTEDGMRKRGWELDLTGHALPGLWDGHAHLLQYGEMLGTVKVYDTTSLHGAPSLPLTAAATNESPWGQ
jgi:hypothetical protein